MYVYCSIAAAIDVNRIARELDFSSLQQSIMTVTFCNIEAEMVSLVETLCTPFEAYLIILVLGSTRF